MKTRPWTRPRQQRQGPVGAVHRRGGHARVHRLHGEVVGVRAVRPVGGRVERAEIDDTTVAAPPVTTLSNRRNTGFGISGTRGSSAHRSSGSS